MTGLAARLFEIPRSATLIARIEVAPTDDCPQYALVANGLSRDEMAGLVEGMSLAG